MKLDEKDLKIIDILYKAEEVKQSRGVEGYTISYIGQEVFGDDANAWNKVRSRLEKMKGYGIIGLDEEGDNTYYLKTDNVVYSDKARIRLSAELDGEEKVFEFGADVLQGLLFVENDSGIYVSGFVPSK